MTDYAGFSSRYIGEYQTAIRLDVADAATVWSNSEINRAVERAVKDVDRHYPKESIYEHLLLNTDVDDEDWTSAVAAGTYTTLANKPIRFGSESVETTDGATTYTRNTDYQMDYTNGKITLISGGDMSNSTDYHISYTKSLLSVDISALISDMLRIVKVEYPLGKTPQGIVSYGIWGDFLYIGSPQPGQSQQQMSDGQMLAIYYESPHTIPASATAPTYPAFMDEVVCKGAIGYMYLTKSDKYKQQAATDTAAALAILASGDFHTAIGAANTAASGVAASLTALTASTAALAAITDANAILDAIVGEEFSLATYGTGIIAQTAVGLLNTRPLGESPVGRASELITARATVAATKVSIARGLLEDAATRIADNQAIAQNNSAIVGAGNVLAAKADAYTSVLQHAMEEANTYVQAAIQDINLASRYYAEGIARLQEFEQLLKEKAEYRKRTSTVMLTQPK